MMTGLRTRLLLLLLLALTATAWAEAPRVETWENGLRCLVLPTTSSQVVSVELLINFSALDEPATLQGLRQVVVSAMMNTPDVNGTRRELTAAGGTLRAQVHQDMVEFAVTAPAGALPQAFQALADIICRPQLSDQAAVWAMRQAQQRAMAAPTGALEGASRLSQDLLYAGHPYVTGTQGRPETLALVTPDTVRWAYGRYIIPAAAVLAVVGRCDPDTVQLHAQGTLGAWQGGVPARRFAFDVPRVPATRLELRQQPVNRICVMLTFPTCGMAHPDYLPLRLLEAVLSGGTGSRLFRGIREERQLAYDVGTIFPAQAHSSHLSVYAIITRAYKMEETKAALVEELGKVQATPVDAAELARAKAYLKGRYLLSHQYSAQQALDLAKYELLGLGADFDSHFAEKIDAITAEDLQRVARAYLRQYYLVVVMPQTAQP